MKLTSLDVRNLNITLKNRRTSIVHIINNDGTQLFNSAKSFDKILG